MCVHKQFILHGWSHMKASSLHISSKLQSQKCSNIPLKFQSACFGSFMLNIYRGSRFTPTGTCKEQSMIKYVAIKLNGINWAAIYLNVLFGLQKIGCTSAIFLVARKAVFIKYLCIPTDAPVSHMQLIYLNY